MTRALIIVARFYEEITDALITGALAKLKQAGVEIEMIEVPGALEIPGALAMAIESCQYDLYIALGCVIRGETSHYDTVCHESARGLNELAMAELAPIGNGIITVENHEQAMERALPDKKDKGGAAATAALRMHQIHCQLGLEVKA